MDYLPSGLVPGHVPVLDSGAEGGATTATAAHVDGKEGGGYLSQVDPFLVEALENPRHRLTVLRMELDIQRFMYSDKPQFEFQHFPTSYLRCAAHRVAQHYGLQTMVLDNMLDGSGKIIVQKTSESRFPSVCLSDVPTKQTELDQSEPVKIVIRPRINKSLQNVDPLGQKGALMKTVEERKEEYDKARARIFSSSGSPEPGDSLSRSASDIRNLSITIDGTSSLRSFIDESEKSVKEAGSRVAILRDREKDRTDPDYDRSYNRYTRSLSMPNQTYGVNPYNFAQHPMVHYDMSFPQINPFLSPQASPGYGPSNQVLNPYGSIGCNQNSRETYMQWPSPTLMYAHSYEHIRNASFQVPCYQTPLSFDNSTNR